MVAEFNWVSSHLLYVFVDNINTSRSKKNKIIAQTADIYLHNCDQLYMKSKTQ